MTMTNARTGTSRSLAHRSCYGLALGGCLALSACSSAPSEAEMRAALDKQLKAEMTVMEGVVGKKAMDMSKGMTPEIKSFRKIGCKEDGEKAYRCDVEVEVSQLGNTSKRAQPMRFVKGADGWAVSL